VFSTEFGDGIDYALLRWGLQKGVAVKRSSKSRAASAELASFYQPSLTAALLALAMALLLLWHGMARAENIAPQDDANPSAAAAPLDSGCSTDSMDFSPEDNLPSPFDADSAAFRQLRMPQPGLQPAAVTNACQAAAQQPDQI
jgi:hypothetical protein